MEIPEFDSSQFLGMHETEILRQQLVLLAERSEEADVELLPELSHAMAEIYLYMRTY